MKWTLDSLESALRKALISSAKLKLGELPPDFSADVTWEEGKGAKIRVDGHKVGIRTAVIHELLHVVLSEDLKVFDETIQEIIIEALESQVDIRVAVSRRRVSWWRKNITSKLRKH